MPHLTQRKKDINLDVSRIAATQVPDILRRVVQLYPSVRDGIDAIADLISDLAKHKQTATELLIEMYHNYPAFNYSIMNKEAALIIRNKKVVDDYTKDAEPEERALLDDTEQEAQLTRQWVLKITQQDQLELKMLRRDFNSPELLLLHKIQARWLIEYRRRFGTKVRLVLFLDYSALRVIMLLFNDYYSITIPYTCVLLLMTFILCRKRP